MCDEYQKQLIKEAVYILRECYAQFNKVCILFSGGKDSVALLKLAKIAFAPTDIPFSLVQIDTGYNFAEVTEFSKNMAALHKIDLIIGKVQDDINSGLCQDDPLNISRNQLQSKTLLRIIKEQQFDCCIGGGRRDEDRARAKERVFSHRDINGSWNPNNQKPEFWNLYKANLNTGEHYRVFPLSNWTENDIWKFILDNELEIPKLYYAKKRNVIKLDDVYYSAEHPFNLEEHVIETKYVRCRTVGDITNTGFFESKASSLCDIYNEIKVLKNSERSNRADDKFSETSMEDRKKEGYF